ncbi:MFS transporter [Micromonospora sp. WMMA1923]|uniref:MFS transporter n=1 Tax=Micromonospora sp. WMMA1923 TaxID=3404125 RepID=UPI003B94AF79
MTRGAAGSRQLALFRALVVGTSAATFGSYLNMVALNLFVYQATGSAWQTGVFMALRLGAGVVAGLVGGLVTVRLPRRPVLVLCDLGQATTLLVLALAGQQTRIGLLPVVAVLTGLLSTTSSVLLRSSVPDLVGDEHRIEANGLLVTGRAVATALGFAAGGLLVGWLGYGPVFLVTAGAFAFSATMLGVLPLRFPRRRSSIVEGTSPPTGKADGGTGRRWRGQVVVGVLAAAPTVSVILAVRAVDALGSASHNVGMPVYATQIQPADPAGFVGNFFAVWAVGLFAAHQVIKGIRRRTSGLDDPHRSELAFIVGTCLMSAAFVAAFAGIGQPWVLVVALIAGLADGFTEITYTTRVQAEPDPRRGYFFGLTAMAENGGLGLGMLLAAALLEVWRPIQVAGVMHGAVVLLAVVVAVGVTVGRRGAGPAAEQPDPAVRPQQSRR